MMAESLSEAGKAAHGVATEALPPTTLSCNSAGGTVSLNISSDTAVLTNLKLGPIDTGCELIAKIMNVAVKKGLGGERDDQEVRDIKPGNHVLLQCLTDGRFLEVLDDYESGRMKECLKKEFSLNGIEIQELKVKIENIEDVKATKAAINERSIMAGVSLTTPITDEERRWVVTGVCLTKVVTPALRNILATEISKWHQALCQPPIGIDKQDFGSHQTQLHPSTLNLNYKNINNNHVHKSPRAFDYTVKDPLSLAKLFVQPFMCKFTGFDQTMDMSAVLSLISEAAPFSGAAAHARTVRSDVRNEWAHCHFVNWTETKFMATFQSMESLLKNLNLPSAEGKKLCNELNSWKDKGFQLCFGQPVDTEIFALHRGEVDELWKAVQILEARILEGKQIVRMDNADNEDSSKKSDIECKAIAVEDESKSADKEQLVEETKPILNYKNSDASKNSPYFGVSESSRSHTEISDEKRNDDLEKVQKKISDNSAQTQKWLMSESTRLFSSGSKRRKDETKYESLEEAPTTSTEKEILCTMPQDKNSNPIIVSNKYTALKYSNLLEDLKLEPNQLNLTLKKVRTVDKLTLKDDEITSPDQIPDYFLNTLMIVNHHARQFKLKPVITCGKTNDNESGDESDDDVDMIEQGKNQQIGINPMDALLAILNCSDDFLRRDIALKLSACQLSVPFLLPDPAAPSENVKILLMTLESITKSWKGACDNNEGAQQVFATEYPFPVVSFIRIGKNTMSKSSLMNKIMSGANGHHDVFFHKDIKGGDVERKIVDGFVELSWYLPDDSEEKALQNEICFVNLRGDARDFKKQLNVLSKISSILCVLLPSEYPDETTKDILDGVTLSKAKVILIFNKKNQEDSKKYFSDLRHKHREKLSLTIRANKANEYDFVQSIQKTIQKNVHTVNPIPLAELASCASEYGIHLDGGEQRLRLGKTIDGWLKLGAKNAKNELKLQTHVPALADLEREMYRPKSKTSDELHKEIEEEKDAQKQSFAKMDGNICQYLNSIAVMDETERTHALTKLTHLLDKMSLQVMAKLREEYHAASLNLEEKKVEACQNTLDALSSEKEHLKQLEESMAKCSFGLKHIMREFAQLHQLADISTIDYAGAAAEMLLSGQPIELLDGDSSYIPLRWFEAVYSKLEYKTNNAKIFVISVLGIQSSGKSTMLNTMFGLEFPVSAGRCTRGAFASLIPVSDSLNSASNFEYVLIIDTEGLKGSGDPLLREHDNELATFAIGVADVTIVNIFGENQNEMKEFLETAVHAFLKMKLVEENKNCKIVHQNVAATDATTKLAVHRGKLRENLDKMAKLAATQENCEDQFQKLNDIISFNENEDVFYIPSLLKGSPPMAPVNPKYGRAVQKVKENIISLMCRCSSKSLHISVSQFRERVSILWKAMLKENFIFSFRNTIEVRAYTSLDRKYFEESVNLMVIGMAELERKTQVSLSRSTTRNERANIWQASEMQIRKEAEKLAEKMESAMEQFFETSEDKATLEQWKQNVMHKIVQHKENQVMEVTKNCVAAFNYWQNRQDVDEKKQKYEKNLLQKAREFINSPRDMENAWKCKAEFEQEWQQWIEDVPFCEERKFNVNDEMIQVLCSTDTHLNWKMIEKLDQPSRSIIQFKGIVPAITINQLSVTYSLKLIHYLQQQQQQHEQECINSAIIIKDQAVDAALNFAKTTSQSGVRCRHNDLTQMYSRVISTIDEEAWKQGFKFRIGLKCEILLYIFASTYEIFDKMEERYFQERDIRGDMETNLRPRLEKYFTNLCNEMEKEVLAATSIVDVLQKPIESELNRTMGPALAREIMKTSEYQSKGQFHANILIKLGEEGKFDSYTAYFENPVKFLRNKLMESIENYCLKHAHASINLLLEEEARKIENKVFAALSTANRLTGSGNKTLTFWIHRLVEDCSTLEITKEMFAVAAIDDNLKDIDMFESKVREQVAQFIQSLVKNGVHQKMMQKWNPSPHDHLFTSMFGCQSYCPFCKRLCDQTVENHVGNHSTRIHHSSGLAGYRNTKTGILDICICTTNVAGNGTFQNADTSKKPDPFKDFKLVNDYYKSWSISPDRSFEASNYWQWFIATFSKEWAEHYKANEPEIPLAWKNLSFKQVKDQLQQDYKLQLK